MDAGKPYAGLNSARNVEMVLIIKLALRPHWDNEILLHEIFLITVYLKLVVNIDLKILVFEHFLESDAEFVRLMTRPAASDDDSFFAHDKSPYLISPFQATGPSTLTRPSPLPCLCEQEVPSPQV